MVEDLLKQGVHRRMRALRLVRLILVLEKKAVGGPPIQGSLLRTSSSTGYSLLACRRSRRQTRSVQTRTTGRVSWERLMITGRHREVQADYGRQANTSGNEDLGLGSRRADEGGEMLQT